MIKTNLLTRLSWLRVVASIAVLAGVALVALLALQGQQRGERETAVRERGAAVMPFDLAKTTHIFTPMETGGVQRVVAKEASDQEQVLLIQQHLQHETQRFLGGDFTDPAAIHLDPSQVHRIVKAAAQRAGLPATVSAHWLRPAHASHALLAWLTSPATILS